MEPLSISLGGAAVKWIVRSWFRDYIPDGFDGDLVDALGGHLGSKFEQRALRRELEGMADNIAVRLQPLMSAEIRGIDNGEREAAALAVQTSLENANAMTAAVITSADMDASILANRIRQADPNAARRAGLGEAGSELYETLLTECTKYIISIAQRLPNYGTVQATEMLKRTSLLIDLTHEILDGLPSPTVPREWGTGSEDERFEAQYKAAASTFSNHLQLFGVTTSTAKSRYPLSVAYISLSVDVDTNFVAKKDAKIPKPEGDWPEGSGLSKDGNSLHIETLLDAADYLLLTGEAGSGKTTLVQWLAASTSETVHAATHSRTKWQGRVPFVIQLRRYVAALLPEPEDFVGTVAPHLVGAMPKSWTHRVLSSGRGMLLIDGLDELPVDRRDEVRDWVLRLISAFPDTKFLVTSRTTAVTKGWKEANRFQKATLQPMEMADIRSFIYHWHDAAASTLSSRERESTLAARKSLLSIVRDRPAIRAICTSPLLCALVCALHLDGGSNVPNNRMDVYKTALDMLVQRRDKDRNVDHLGDIELGYREREILLRSFALWLHENGASDTTRSIYNERIKKQLEALHKVKTPPSSAADYLLERSGVLREPVPGRVDFVHRTFLEYLAAAAIVDDNSIERLILQAHDDHWREVIVMAAGHSNSQQRISLLEGLLDRGEQNIALRPRLYMLAVACMETSPDLPTGLVSRLQTALSTVLPPTNMTDAAAVASAGTLAVNMLSQAGHGATIAAASVRALSLIGGDDALSALASYGNDKRVTVTRQLIRAWSGFDTEKYADQVLRNSPLDNGKILINDPDQLSMVGRLKHATTIDISLSNDVSDFSIIPNGHRGVRGLEMSSPDLLSITELPSLPNLRVLILRESALKTLDGIDQYTLLRVLSLQTSRALTDLSAVGQLPELRNLFLYDSTLTTLESLRSDVVLGVLRLVGSAELVRIPRVIAAKTAHITYAPRLEDISGLAISNELTHLSLDVNSPRLRTLTLPPSLSSLDLTWFPSSGVVSISGAGSLNYLYIVSESINPVLFDWIEEHLTIEEIIWHHYYSGYIDPSLERTVEQLFSSSSLQTVILHTSQEAPEIPGLYVARGTYETTYTRLV